MGKLMVLDIQGVGYTLFDPEIASIDRFISEGEDAEALFYVGNLFEKGIDKFKEDHICNKW